ncbi:phosphotyrosine protein phosphatase [Rheinheimera aquimaris]|uniref:phosphotyrosine protein phosphatase n=1 Tax=Rheinheimera aquimaris TaxID=412437 RepID=UPI0010651B45|nr:phosphotyrosine protein phosphatase [Rheinheimera aquimaris]
MNILFLCTSNLHRSRTAEDFFSSIAADHQYKSAGLSQKYCQIHGTTLCTTGLLEWADKIYVMEDLHVQRIAEHTGQSYLNKLEVLDIDDVYKYMQPELIEKLKSNEKLRFLCI